MKRFFITFSNKYKNNTNEILERRLKYKVGSKITKNIWYEIITNFEETLFKNMYTYITCLQLTL